MRDWKWALLAVAHRRFLERASPGDSAALAAFCRDQAHWLDGYALYAALKASHGSAPLDRVAGGLSRRDPQALAEWSQAIGRGDPAPAFPAVRLLPAVAAAACLRQGAGVRLVGDMPIFVAHDSSEVWTHREWFHLEAAVSPRSSPGSRPTISAPPASAGAIRSTTGTAWPRTATASGSSACAHLLGLVDLVRIDHFRGFAGYWEIPGDEATAVNGRWVAGPGMDLFSALRRDLGADLPLIAEDLGVITPDVEALRDGLELPGMAILQFAFETTPTASARAPSCPTTTAAAWWSIPGPTTTTPWPGGGPVRRSRSATRSAAI